MGQIQEQGSSFYTNVEEKVWLLVEKYRLTKTDRVSLFCGNKAISLNQGEKVAHFTWFGESCVVFKNIPPISRPLHLVFGESCIVFKNIPLISL